MKLVNLVLPTSTYILEQTQILEKGVSTIAVKLFLSFYLIATIWGVLGVTYLAEAKMSRGLQRLIKLKDWKDSYHTLFPEEIL